MVKKALCSDTKEFAFLCFFAVLHNTYLKATQKARELFGFSEILTVSNIIEIDGFSYFQDIIHFTSFIF